MFDPRLTPAYWALRFGIGLTALLAGLDKFFGLLANWEGYLSPLAVRLLPVSPATFLAFVGVVEMAVGLAVLTRLTRLGAYVASAWLFLIALQLVTTGHFFDIAVRDVVLSLSAFTLARLSEARGHVPAAARPGLPVQPRAHAAG